MKSIRELLAARRPSFGVFAQSGSPVIVEMIGHAGFDFVVIDCEHSSISPLGRELETLLRAADSAGIATLVRVADNRRDQILKALDMGAAGVVVPHIASVSDAETLVRWGRFPPEGARSACPPVRAARFGAEAWPSFYERQSGDPVLIALLEDPEGVGNADAIASLDGIDGIFFGPFDLAVSLGVATAGDEPTIRQWREAVYSAANKHDKLIADLAWDVESARMMSELGASLVAIGTDTTMFADACRRLTQDVAGLRSRASLE